MPIQFSQQELNNLLKELLNNSILEGRDERVPEVPNLREDDGLEVEVVSSDPKIGLPRKNPLGANYRVAQNNADEKNETKPADPYDVQKRTQDLLNLVEELIEYHVRHKAYEEVARLAAFYSSTPSGQTVAKEDTRPKYNTPVTLTTLLREKSPETLRPRTEQVAPPISPWWEQFQEIWAKYEEAHKPKKKKPSKKSLKTIKAKKN